MSKHISEEKFQELGIVQLPAQELVVRVGEMFLQVLGHPKALLALGAEDRLHGFVGSEPLPVLLVLVLEEVYVGIGNSLIFKTRIESATWRSFSFR